MCRAYRLAQVFVTMSISWGVGLGLILTAEVFYIAMYSRWSSQLFLIWALRLLIVLPMLSVRPHPTWMGWTGWDGMGWDGMGWDGMGWDSLLYQANSDTARCAGFAKHCRCKSRSALGECMRHEAGTRCIGCRGVQPSVGDVRRPRLSAAPAADAPSAACPRRRRRRSWNIADHISVSERTHDVGFAPKVLTLKPAPLSIAQGHDFDL